MLLGTQVPVKAYRKELLCWGLFRQGDPSDQFLTGKKRYGIIALSLRERRVVTTSNGASLYLVE